VEQEKASRVVDNTTPNTTSTEKLPAIEASSSSTSTSSPKTKSSNKSTTTRRRHYHSPPTTTSPTDEEFHNIKTIAATIVRSQKKQVAAMQLYRQEMEQNLQKSHAKHHQERLEQLEQLEKLQQRHFQSQLIALDMKEKRIMARVKKVEARVNKTLELSKQVRQVKERRQDVKLEQVKRSVDATRGTLDAFSARTEKRLQVAEVRLEQECRMNDYFRSDFRANALHGWGNEELQLDFDALHGWSSGDDEDDMAPIVYATPYVVEDEEEEEIDSVVPLCPKPIHNGGGRTKRAYPRRKRRYLLGPLNFSN